MNEICERCRSRPARPQVCPGDNRMHHHGAVHVRGGGFESVCDECLIDVKREWNISLVRQPKETKA